MLLITAVKDGRHLKHHVSKTGYDLSFQEDSQDQNCYPQDRSKVHHPLNDSRLGVKTEAEVHLTMDELDLTRSP